MVASETIDETAYGTHKAAFVAFLESGHGTQYRRVLKDLVSGEEDARLAVDVADVRRFDAQLAYRLLQRPLLHLTAWTQGIQDWISQHHYSTSSVSRKHVEIGLVGNFGARHVTPRQLCSAHLGEHVSVEGVVTHACLTLPKIVRTIYWSEATQQHYVHETKDSTSPEMWLVPRATTKGSKYDEGLSKLPRSFGGELARELEIEHGLSTYMDQQRLIVQEAPEVAPFGQLPRSVHVLLQNDLVESARPGDRIVCSGVYRALPSETSATTFQPTLFANFVSKVQQQAQPVRGHQDSGDLVFPPSSSEEEEEDARERVRAEAERTVAEMEKKNAATTTSLRQHTPLRALNTGPILTALSSLLAPSMYGLDAAKCALVLQLVGGNEKILASGTRLRGDVNVLLVGDPSTAKSQLLRATMRVAPIAVSTSGRGSSGVGLTASVSHDPESGERRLEAGAVVLADGGIVCIDEFDKMSVGDRVTIHEVMEQQTVTLAKAGIHASLNARCAVLAAANPVHGHYDVTKRPQENIGLPDSLLSRFDLTILTLDDIDADQAIATHVTHLHRHRADVLQYRAASLSVRAAADAKKKHGSLLDNPSLVDPGSDWLRSHIAYARSHVKPELSDEARTSLANDYAELRSKADENALPVTARCLESLIRLATAHAKIRLSDQVTAVDCQYALKLVSLTLYGVHGGGALFSDDPPGRADDGSPDDDDADADDDQAQAQADDDQGDAEMNPVSPDRRQLVVDVLSGLQRNGQADSGLSVDQVLAACNATASPVFDAPQIRALLQELARENRLMLDQDAGQIYLC